MNLKWDCKECGHEWEDEPIYTYEECPECGSEDVGHW
jgi:predicted Zn-ribbon and HTH transcriptional regulator